MTDRDKFMAVVNRNNMKIYEVAADLGMAPQTLYNKLGNTSEFSQTELSRFRTIFPDVSNKEFEQIFFCSNISG